MGACYIQHFQYDFRLFYLDKVSRVSLYKNKETEKLKVIETLIMLKYQIIFSVVYFTLFIALFFVGRYNGLLIQTNPDSAFSKISKIIMWVIGALIFAVLVFVLKRKQELESFYSYYYLNNYQIIMDGHLISAIFILSIGLMVAVEGGYRLVFKKKYENAFYVIVFMSTIILFYLCVFIAIPERVYKIGTYDGHLNPKVIKMKKQEEKKVELKNEKSNEHQ